MSAMPIADITGTLFTGSLRHAVTAFPVGGLLATERRRTAVGPSHYLGAVVGGEDDNGIVGDAEIVEPLEQLPNIAVELDHYVGIDTVAGLALRFRFQMRPHMHAGGIEVGEPRRVFLGLAVDEIDSGFEKLLVHGLHTLGV